MALLRALTYLCAFLWGLGVYSNLMGDWQLGSSLVTIFGSLAILLGLIQLVIWVKNKHGTQISQSAVSAGQWASRSLMMLLGLAGAFLVIWMMTYETLPGGMQHRNRITGFVCYIDRSCWFSED